MTFGPAARKAGGLGIAAFHRRTCVVFYGEPRFTQETYDRRDLIRASGEARLLSETPGRDRQEYLPGSQDGQDEDRLPFR